MNQYTASMSHQAYKNFCEDFFVGILSDAKSITQYITDMTINDFKVWSNKVVAEYYDKKQQLVRDLVKKMRANSDEEVLRQENQELLDSYRTILNSVLDEKFHQVAAVKELNDKLIAQAKEEIYQRSLEVKVDGIQFKVIAKCDVYWTGWECDSTAWIVEYEGQNKLVTTNHGGANFTDKAFLEGKIKEYEDAIANTRKMLEML